MDNLEWEADGAASLPVLGGESGRRPVIYIECTHTYDSTVNTGIQRVVRNILRYAPGVCDEKGYDVVPVIVGDKIIEPCDISRVLADKQKELDESQKERFYIRPLLLGVRNGAMRLLRQILSLCLPWSVQNFVQAPSYKPGLARNIRALLGLPPTSAPGRPPRVEAKPAESHYLVGEPGDILLLLDSSWHNLKWSSVARFKANGATAVGVFYDLIPISHAETCVPELVYAFTFWTNDSIKHADGYVCISRVVADEVRAYIAGSGMADKAHSPQVSHFHLGSELDFVDPASQPRRSFKALFDGKPNVFLMVGTIEPRKNHVYALDAFDLHWRNGGEATLVIVGRQSWKSDALLERIEKHEQLGRRLFIVRDATDVELDYAYHNAAGLIISSKIEGFGLPIVEAFQRGLPVLCSDIPVFREIADGKATFFDLQQPASLVQEIDEVCKVSHSGKIRTRQLHGWITWRQSTEQLLESVLRVKASSMVIAGLAQEPGVR